MIKRNTAVVSISLPQKVLAELNSWAELERKTKTEIVKEALSWYRNWKLKKDINELRDLGKKTRKKFNFQTEEDLYQYIHGD